MESLSPPSNSVASHPGHYTVVSAADFSDSTSIYGATTTGSSSPLLSSMTSGFSPYHHQQPPDSHYHHSLSPQPGMNLDFSNQWSPPFHSQYIDPAMSSTPDMHSLTTAPASGTSGMGHRDMGHDGGNIYVLPSQPLPSAQDQRYWNEHGHGWGWRS